MHLVIRERLSRSLVLEEAYHVKDDHMVQVMSQRCSRSDVMLQRTARSPRAPTPACCPRGVSVRPWRSSRYCSILPRRPSFYTTAQHASRRSYRTWGGSELVSTPTSRWFVCHCRWVVSIEYVGGWCGCGILRQAEHTNLVLVLPHSAAEFALLVDAMPDVAVLTEPGEHREDVALWIPQMLAVSSLELRPVLNKVTVTAPSSPHPTPHNI